MFNLENFLDNCVKGIWINTPNGIYVKGSVHINSRNLKEIPVKFLKVTENFYCYNNKLTTLKNSPKYVGKIFNCSYNKLTTLEFGPKYVFDSYICNNNALTTLSCKVSTKILVKFDCSFNKLKSIKSPCTFSAIYFNCSSNKLTSLDNLPELILYFNCSSNNLKNFKSLNSNIIGSINCSFNKLTSLEGCPSKIEGEFDCSYNKLKTLNHISKASKICAKNNTNVICYGIKTTRIDIDSSNIEAINLINKVIIDNDNIFNSPKDLLNYLIYFSGKPYIKIIINYYYGKVFTEKIYNDINNNVFI